MFIEMTSHSTDLAEEHIYSNGFEESHETPRQDEEDLAEGSAASGSGSAAASAATARHTSNHIPLDGDEDADDREDALDLLRGVFG